MNRNMALQVALAAFLMTAPAGPAYAEPGQDEPPELLVELSDSAYQSHNSYSILEDLIEKGSPLRPNEGFASYYARRFEGRRTTSGHRYHPDKLTAAHESLPLGTVVRVINPDTNEDVHVLVNDRCARRPYPFIDLSRAAAQKIGLWGKGRMKVVILPLAEAPLVSLMELEEPV